MTRGCEISDIFLFEPKKKAQFCFFVFLSTHTGFSNAGTKIQETKEQQYTCKNRNFTYTISKNTYLFIAYNCSKKHVGETALTGPAQEGAEPSKKSSPYFFTPFKLRQYQTNVMEYIFRGHTAKIFWVD